MNLFPFKKILGLEISKKDYEICKNNFNLLNINNIELQNIDINDFTNYSNYNYFYFYNPFNSKLFEKNY